MIGNTSKFKDDQMSRKALYMYIRYYKMWNLCCVNSRNFRLDWLEHYYFFIFRKESNLVQMYRFGHNVTWRDAHCESSSEFIDLNLSMFAEDYRTFLQECQKWRVYPFGHNVELTGKCVSKPASNSTLELWQKGLKICG